MDEPQPESRRSVLSFFRSRTFFFITILVFPLVSVCGSLRAWETPVSLEWPLAAVLFVLLIASLAVSKKRCKDYFPQASLLWRLLLLSAVCDCACNLFAFVAPWQLPISIFMMMGCVCLLWVLLRWGSLLLWAPFIFLQLAQQVGHYQYGTRLNSLVLAETMEASAEELLTYLTPLNMTIAICAFVGAVIFFISLGRMLKQAHSKWSLFNAGLLFCLLSYLVGMVQPPHHRRPEYYWPAVEAYDLFMACSEALMHNQATIEQAEGLPLPTSKPSSMHTLKGKEGVVLVVHIGESVRADRMSLNGYERDTTPWLRSQTGLINFPDCISAACDTCQAQIAILTNARRDIWNKQPEMQPTTGSVLELFHRHGFKVYSFFGQRCGQKLKYDRVVRVLTKCSEARFNAPGSPWTSLPQISSVVDANRKDNLLVFINNEGSHTPFNYYDKATAPFLPSATNFQNPAAHAEEVNNAYDNTVHYTDEFIRRVVQVLRGRPFIYLYISDHGEYLGHDGLWGRAALGESKYNYHSTTGCRVGMFVITSPDFEKMHPHFAQALQQMRTNSTQTVAQEHIFHTLLGLFGISTPYYDATLDICSDKMQPYSGLKPEPTPQP